MKDLTVRQLQAYLLEHYQQSRTEEGLFIKLVEEVGEVAEVLNGRDEKRVFKTQMRNLLKNLLILYIIRLQSQLSTILI